MRTPEIIPVVILEALILIIFAFIPIVRREHAFFGVPVAREYYQGEGRAVLRRYRLWLVAIYFVFVISEAIFSAFHIQPLAWVATAILVIAGALWKYAVAYQSVRPFHIHAEENRIASSLGTRQLRDYTRLPIELLVLLFTFLPLATLFFSYRSLPSPMPIHWNFAGQADRWVVKSITAAFFLPVLAIYLQAWLFLLKRDSVWLKMTLPAQRTEEYLQYKERGLGIGAMLLDWTRLMLALVLSLVALLPVTSIPAWRFLYPTLELLLWTSLALLLAGVMWLIGRWLRVSNALHREFGFAMVQRRGEADHWHGGIFYFNRDDPALFVEKLGGLGYTINCAHPRALVHLAAVLGVIGMAVWAGVKL